MSNNPMSLYATPRRCNCCDFKTQDRDVYWAHVIAHRDHEEHVCGCPVVPCVIAKEAS